MILLLSAILNILITWQTTKRMDAIENAIVQIRGGDYNVALPNDNADNLGLLECDISAMAMQIESTMSARNETERSKDDFIVNIAHDLRTPLTSIIGYLTFLTERNLAPEISAKYATIAFDKSKQLENLVESLFDVAHLAFDAIIVSKETVDLKKFLAQKQDELFPQLHNADMEMRLQISAALVYVDGDLMARVFDNLISNAIRYAKEGKYIDVRSQSAENNVQISFVTHANPVPQDELEHIFDKLYRLEQSRSTTTGGTGLGLSISRRIVELHGGTLTARQAEGGTAFDICLPNHNIELRK